MATGVAALLPVFSSATVGLAEDERTVLALNSGNVDERNGHGVLDNDGTLSLSALDYNYTAQNVGAGGALDTATVVNHADFGNLSINMNGTAQSSSQSGAFVWGTTHYGGDDNVGFYDEVTASVNSVVDFLFTIKGTSSANGNPDGNTISDTFATYSVTNTGFNGGLDPTSLNGTATFFGEVHLSAGVPYQMFFGIGYSTSAYSNDQNSYFASVSESAHATLVVTNETAGSTLRFGSGHDYTQAAPEPLGVAILALGVAGLMFKARR